jgi:hypothetical protein
MIPTKLLSDPELHRPRAVGSFWSLMRPAVVSGAGVFDDPARRNARPEMKLPSRQVRPPPTQTDDISLLTACCRVNLTRQQRGFGYSSHPMVLGYSTVSIAG